MFNTHIVSVWCMCQYLVCVMPGVRVMPSVHATYLINSHFFQKHITFKLKQTPNQPKIFGFECSNVINKLIRTTTSLDHEYYTNLIHCKQEIRQIINGSTLLVTHQMA